LRTRAVAGIAIAVVFASAPAVLRAEGKKDAAKRESPKSLSQTLTGTAKADFEAAKLLASDGDFAGALIKFQSAYDASKDPRLLWNIAFCHKNLRHYAKVTATLKQYIEKGGSLLSAGDKKDAQDLIAMIEPFTTRATLKVSPDGAQIFVDDEAAGTSPLAGPIVLDIGERHLRVAKDGFTTYEKPVMVAGGPELTLTITLQKEIHEGTLVVEAPAGASVFIDDHQVGTGRVTQKVASGGHQLRVTAPGMRQYQTEVVIQDRETRSLNVLLESVATGEKPMLRVAVGCADSDPRGPDDGLTIEVDNEALPLGSVKQKWSAEAGRNIVEYVQVPVSAGAHTVRIGLAECRPLETRIDVDPVKGADLRGALESSRFVLFRGPQGTPGFLRAGLGLWLSASGTIKDKVPEQYRSDGLSVTGVTADVGLVWRWYGLFLDASYGSGSFHRDSFNTHFALPDPAHVTWERVLVRTGPRIPFNRAAFGFGPLIGVEEVDLDQVRTGKPQGMIGAYAEADVQPLCDFGLFATASLEKSFNNDGPSGGLQFGVFYEPNARCRRERDTAFGLRQQR